MSGTGVSDVSLTTPMDYATQLAQIQRQQQLAQQLQQQANAPIDVQSYKGIQAPISPFSVLAKALQGYEAGNLAYKGIKAQSDLSKTDVQQAMAGLNAANIPYSAGTAASLGQSMQYTLPSTPINGTQVGQINGQTGIVPSATPSGSTSPLQYTLGTPDLPAGQSSYQQQMDAVAPLLGGGPVSKAIGEQIFASAAKDQETQQTTQRQLAAMAPIIATMPADQQTMVTNLAAVEPTKALDFITAYQQKKASAPQILTAQQAAAKNLPPLTRPGSYYQGSDLEGYKPLETSDMDSPGKVAQLGQIAAQNRSIIVNNPTVPSMNNYKLPGNQGQLLDQAIVDGRLDPNKLNSRTASIYGQVLSLDPGADLVTAGGIARMKENPAFQSKVMTAATIPQMLTNLQNATNQLDYSNLSSVGGIQKWAKGQTNDPALAKYGPIRNDLMLKIAGAMRATGMSDVATNLEDQVNNPTMSPQAVTGYIQGQMESLQPMLQMYAPVTLRTKAYGAGSVPVTAGTTMPNLGGGQSAPASGKTVVRTGTDKATGKKVTQYSDGSINYVP